MVTGAVVVGGVVTGAAVVELVDNAGCTEVDGAGALVGEVREVTTAGIVVVVDFEVLDGARDVELVDATELVVGFVTGTPDPAGAGWTGASGGTGLAAGTT